MWLPVFACPVCHGPLDGQVGEMLACPRCELRFDRRGGIFRFLTPSLERAAEPFLRQYRTVREHDGYRSTSAQYYRMLPYVPPDDPQAAEWRLRRESYAHLLRDALPLDASPALRVLDVGSGCGWLSHRLATLGHHAVAVDRIDDEADGLGAYRHYEVAFAAVQADFDHLPFQAAQFDLVVFEGVLHYAPDPAATLTEAGRVLVPGGSLVVMDSPVFARDADGEAMMTDLLRRLRAAHTLPAVIRPGVGFLTYHGMDAAFGRLGMKARFVRSWGPFTWRVRRELARFRLGREPAAFGVWIAN